MEEKYQVYAHRNKITGKVYVGATKHTWQERWRTKYRKNVYMNAAALKYSEDDWEHYVVADGLTREEAGRIERQLIREMRLTDRRIGYNVGRGGEGIIDDGSLRAVQSTEEYHQHLSEAMKKVWASRSPEIRRDLTAKNAERLRAYGRERRAWTDPDIRARMMDGIRKAGEKRRNDPENIKRKEETRERQRARNREYYANNLKVPPDLAHQHRSDAARALWSKEDYRESMSKKLSDVWERDGYREAAAERMRAQRTGAEWNDAVVSNISAGMKAKWKDSKYRISQGGRERQERTQEQKDTARSIMTEKYGRSVRCLNTGVVYPSVADAAREFGLNKKRLREVLCGKQRSIAGYRFEYAESPKDVAAPVMCVETGVVYESLTSAEAATGAKKGNISLVCSGRRKMAGGFHWKYA